MPTQVTGTLIDSLGQKWANAPIQFVFFPTPGTPGPFTENGADFNKMPPVILTDTNGAFSISLTSNSDIKPANSQWQMIIGPNSSYPAIVLTIYLGGGALDVSSLFAASGAVMAVQSIPIPRAYADSEVLIPPYVGQLYYNVSEKAFKYWESGNWATLGVSHGGDMVYPPAGIAVSTGTSWAASIDPATLANINISNTWALPQYFTDIHVSHNAYFANDKLVIGAPGAVAPGTIPAILSDGSNIILDPAGSGGVLLSWDSGTGTYFGNGAGGRVGNIDTGGNMYLNGSGTFGGNLTATNGLFNGNLNVGSFQVQGPQPAGYILQSNGTSFVPVPFPAASHGVLNVTITDYTGQTDPVTGRNWDGIYQNTGTGIRTVSGTGRTAGGTPGSTQALIGFGNPTTQVWGNTVTSTLVQGSAGFYFTVPPGALYTVRKNTLSQGPGGGNGVLEIQHWLETDTTIV